MFCCDTAHPAKQAEMLYATAPPALFDRTKKFRARVLIATKHRYNSLYLKRVLNEFVFTNSALLQNASSSYIKVEIYVTRE